MMPPPVLPAPKPIDAGNAHLSAGLLHAMTTARNSWEHDDGGKEFRPGLTYVHGMPHLMLITSRFETIDARNRRHKAIITAFDFLLDDVAFDRARLSIVVADPTDRRTQIVENYELRRGPFQAAVKSGAKSATAKEGIGKVRAGHAATANTICAILGVK
jgi:hypothetical protein